MSVFSNKLLPSIKITLRVAGTTDFDEEISSYIDTAAADLMNAGILSLYFNAEREDWECDAQIKQAVRWYCLSVFGLYNADMEKYQRAYSSLKATLATQKKYRSGTGANGESLDLSDLKKAIEQVQQGLLNLDTKKQDSIIFDYTYNKNTNKAVTEEGLKRVRTIADQATELSSKLIQSVKNAQETAEYAREEAKIAQQTANYIDDIAGQALYLAGQTLGTANEAKTIATQTQSDFEVFKTETETNLAELHETINTEITEQIATEKSERENAVKTLRETKQDNLSFDGQYNATTNKVATVKTVSNEIAKVVANAPAGFDTLKEIAEWIAEHPESVAQLNALIKANTDDIVEIKAEQATQNEDIQNNTALINDLADTAIRQIQKVERDFLESDQTINGAKTFTDTISLTDDGSHVSRTELALDGYRTAYGTDFIKWEGVLLYFPTAVDGSNQGDETLATREWVENGIRSTAEPFLISKDVDGVRRSTLVLGEKGTKSTDGTIIYKAGLQSENTNITAYEIVGGEKITRAGIALDFNGDIHAIGASFKWNEKEIATKDEFDIVRCV